MRQLRCALVWLALVAAAPAFAARDVILVLDNSGSMRANDPSRLAVAAVRGFIEAQPADTRVGIVLFSATAELAAPLTPAPAAALTGALAGFDYRGQWTQIAGAVERGLYELRQHGRPDAARSLVLITDGLIDTGDAARDTEARRWLQESLAAQARRDHVRLFGIAFTERADYQLLQSLAAATEAEYFRVLAPQDLAPALSRIEATLAAADPAPAAMAAAPPGAPAAAVAPVEPAPARKMPVWLVAVLAAAFVAIAAVGLRRRRKTRGAAPPAAAPGEPAGPLAVLVDLAYPSGPRRYPIAHRPLVIGRQAGSDPNQDYVVVPEKTVGRWHATIRRSGQSFTIRDENSVNGTFVNNERISGDHPLKHSDIVRVHAHTFEFLIPDLANSESTVLHASH